VFITAGPSTKNSGGRVILDRYFSVGLPLEAAKFLLVRVATFFFKTGHLAAILFPETRICSHDYARNAHASKLTEACWSRKESLGPGNPGHQRSGAVGETRYGSSCRID
jgi:hypothetical protein